MKANQGGHPHPGILLPSTSNGKNPCILLPLLALAALFPLAASGQNSTALDSLGQRASTSPNALSQPTLSPGLILLMELEGRFQSDVAAGGGKAFASWFADDGVTLGNGRPPVIGRAAIADNAIWTAKEYQLTWQPQGGQMSPQGDMGYTWGHYEGRSTDKTGNPVITSGRYLTIWKKMADGQWKVAVDSSSDEPPNAADCCSLPKP